MEEVKVFYKPAVEHYINELVYVLYDRDYFSFLENAILYKDNLVDYIEQNIGILRHRNTPIRLVHLGSKYIFYKANDRTTWYVFFEKRDNEYIITFITNNHTEIAGML